MVVENGNTVYVCYDTVEVGERNARGEHEMVEYEEEAGVVINEGEAELWAEDDGRFYKERTLGVVHSLRRDKQSPHKQTDW